jgi:hypothetical protein
VGSKHTDIAGTCGIRGAPDRTGAAARDRPRARRSAMVGGHTLVIDRACHRRSNAWADFWSPTVGARPFLESEQNNEHAYTLYNFSAGEDAAEGRWASGSTPDGRGQFTYLWLCRSSMSPSERPSP